MGQEDESPRDIIWGHGDTGHGGLVTERGQKGHCGRGKSGGVDVGQKWGGWGHRTGSRREWDNEGTPRREGGPEPHPGRKWWKWSWSRSHMIVLGGGGGLGPPPGPLPKMGRGSKAGSSCNEARGRGGCCPFCPFVCKPGERANAPPVCECANSPPIVSPPPSVCKCTPPSFHVWVQIAVQVCTLLPPPLVQKVPPPPFKPPPRL